VETKAYGVTTRRLNEHVRRNRERFPDDFMLQLASCDHPEKSKFSKSMPFAFPAVDRHMIVPYSV